MDKIILNPVNHVNPVRKNIVCNLKLYIIIFI